MQNSIVESDDSGIPFANDSTRTPLNINQERIHIRTFYGISIGIQIFMYLATYVMTPGYIVPLLNQPVARLIILLLFFWEVVAAGVHWYLAPVSKINRTVLFALILLFIYVPGYLFPMLGPACIAIFNAIGPIMLSK
jgi:hypothetical protein